MKLQVERDHLADAVAWTARALPARPTAPVLAGMRLHGGTELTLSTFDYEVSAQATVPVITDEEGAVLVSGRLLAEIVRSLPAKPVDLSTDGTRATLKCGSATFTLVLLPEEEYPTLPEMPPLAGSVGSDALASAIGQVAIAAGRDDTLPALTGIRIEISRRHAHPGRHRQVPAGRPRAALEPGAAGPEHGRARPGPRARRHGARAHLRRGGVDIAGRRQPDRLRRRRAADHHQAAVRRVPQVLRRCCRASSARSPNSRPARSPRR